MCERAKSYVSPKLKMVISECWNEFGEGSYIEPCDGFGFGYLHALRDAFGRGGPYPSDAIPTSDERRRFSFQTIPPDPNAVPLGKQSGNLIADPAMEEETGWVNFGGGPSRFVARTPHAGKRCLEIRPGVGGKAILPTPVVFQRTYQFSAWVRCSPRATATVSSALFDRDGGWTGKYVRIGEASATTWTEVKKLVRVSEPGVGGMNLEFVADGDVIWIDDSSITVNELEPPPTLLFEEDCRHGEGWVTYEGKPASVQPLGEAERPVLIVPPATGIKTMRQIPVSPGSTLSLRVRLRCDPLATAVIQCAAFDERHEWIPGVYLSSGAYSWQEWTEVTINMQVPTDSPARNASVECFAEGGRVLLGGVKIVAGGLSR